jgi:hypothetical protein
MRFYGFEYSNTKHGYGIKRYNKKTTGSIHYDRYKNLPLNFEYEFELFVEFNERFHKAALINVNLVKTNYLSKS